MKKVKWLILGALILAMTVPAMAVTNSLTMTFSVDESVTYCDGTVHYELILTNQNIPGANPAIVDVTFNPPGPTGAAGAYGPPVLLDDDLNIPVGATVMYNYNGSGGAIAKPALAVDLGAIPLDCAATAAYALASFNGIYVAVPPYDAIDSRNVPVAVINPSTDVGISADETTVLPGDPVVLTIKEKNDGNVSLSDPCVVLLANGSPHSASPLRKGSTEYVGGDNNPDNGVLDPLEEWEWQVTDNPTVDTTYTVIGHGTDSLGNDVTWCDDSPADTVCDEDEKDEVSVTVECPEPCVEITKTVDCEISKVDDEVTYTICILNCGDSNLVDVSVTDDLLGPLAGFPSVLEPDDPCCLDFPYTIQPGDWPGPVVNQAHVEAIDECDGETPVLKDSEEVTVVIVKPEFTVTKDCRLEPLQIDDVAIFDVYFENTGDVCLRFDVCDIDPCSFDLAPGESMGWETRITVESEEDVENTVTGTAILLPGDPLTTCGDPCACLPNILPVEASDECEVSVGATRTPGFWKTHYYLTKSVLETHCMDDVNLGWVDANDIDVMMAIFWEKKAHQSKLCQARIQGSFHAMAALLNNCHPDGLSLADYMSDHCSAFSPADIPVILGGCDVDAIKELASCLGSYNEAGDDVEITFPAGLEAYNAQPKYAREQAEGRFPDTACDACDNGAAVEAVKGKGKGKNK